MTETRHSGKIEVVNHLLEREGRVLLFVDATRKQVDVPRRFKQDVELRLVLTSQMPQPILVGPEFIESTLGFGGTGHRCIIPLDALWGAYNPETGHGRFWPESMPPALRDRFGFSAELIGRGPPPGHPCAVPPAGGADQPKEAEASPKPPPAPGFRPKVVEGSGQGKGGGRKPNLRVIK